MPAKIRQKYLPGEVVYWRNPDTRKIEIVRILVDSIFKSNRKSDPGFYGITTSPFYDSVEYKTRPCKIICRAPESEVAFWILTSQI